MELKQLTLTQAVKDLQEKKYTSVELTTSYLERIHTLNDTLNAFITICDTEALAMAEAADKKLAQGEKQPLLGVPIVLKDNFLTKGIRTTAASNVLKNYIGQYDGTVVKKLRDAGAVTLGKANCDAWAHGSSGENSDFEPTKNPYNTAYVPGGSSSGSPTAVAADMGLMATGSDTGGSIRLPASFCNVVGIKPTYGRVSRYGVIAMASSLDCIGHFTKTVEDNALVLNVTAGTDPMDATTLPKDVPDYQSLIGKGVKGMRIGYAKAFTNGLTAEMNDNYETTLKAYENLGAELVEVTLPHAEYAIAVYYIIQTAEVSSNLARFDGIRYGNTRDHFGAEAKRRIMLGTYVLSAGYYDAYYKKAMQVRTLIRKDFESAFTSCDVILTPTSPTSPWKFGEKMADPLQMYLSDIFTVTANLSGNPGISVPTGFINGLPVGMQLLGPYFAEDRLYQAAAAFETEHPYWKEEPKL